MCIGLAQQKDSNAHTQRERYRGEGSQRSKRARELVLSVGRGA